MLTKIMINKIKARMNALLDNGLDIYSWESNEQLKKFGFLGRGIHRSVFILDSNYVMKIEKIFKHKDSTINYVNDTHEDLRFELLKQFTENKVTNEQYLDYVNLCSLKIGTDSIQSFLCEITFRTQSYQELLNWKTIENSELSKRIVPVYGMIVYKNFRVTVQDRGAKVDANDSQFQRLAIIQELFDNRFDTNDLHCNNIVRMKDGTFKICDTGLCKFKRYNI